MCCWLLAEALADHLLADTLALRPGLACPMFTPSVTDMADTFDPQGGHVFAHLPLVTITPLPLQPSGCRAGAETCGGRFCGTCMACEAASGLGLGVWSPAHGVLVIAFITV